MISRIQLKNWRSHLDSSLEFTSGTNALLGSMGSGKSSVMNAICFGLFGTFPDLQSRKIKLDDIIMNKPSVKNESQIVVDFTVDDKTYSVMRVIEKNKGTTYSEIREGDKLLDSPNSQRVTELVEKLLKINYELFSRAIYSEQNGLDYFLRLPRGERMKRIDNLLMIDRFEKVRSNTVTLKNKLVERKIGKESILGQTDVRELKKSLDDIDYSLKKLSETKTNLSENLGNEKAKKEKLEKEIKSLESFEKELNNLKNKKNSLEGSIKENQNLIDNYKKLLKDKNIQISKQELKDTTKLIEKYQKELNQKRDEQEKLTGSISENNTKITFLKNKTDELGKEIKEQLEFKQKLLYIEKEFGKNPNKIFIKEKQELEDLQKTITELSTNIQQTQESLTKISEVEDKCPVCESEITEEKRQSLTEDYGQRIKSHNDNLKKNMENLEAKKQLIRELEQASKDFEVCSVIIKDLKKIEKNLEEKIREHLTLVEALSRKKKNFEKIKKEILDLEESLNKLKDKKQQLESSIEKSLDLIEKEKRYNKLTGGLNNLNKQILTYSKKFGEKNLQKNRQEFTAIVSKVSELSTRIYSLNDIINEKNNRRKEYQEKIQQLEKQKKEIDQLEKLIKDLKIFEKALEKTQTQLRENFVDTVNYTMDQIWSDIYPYPDFTSARLAVKDRDYVLQVQGRSGEWTDVDGIVSGGERSIASLVLRIAFSSVLAPQLKWLVLDEPTHNLDSKSVEDLSETLKTRISDFAEQVFLITHEKSMENAVTGQLYRLSRNKELDDVTKIQRVN